MIVGQQQMEVLRKDRFVQLLRMRSTTTGTCLVSFTGVGRALGGVDVQDPEFLSAGRFGESFYVIDMTRSWGNALDVEAICDAIRRFAGDQDIVTIGNSMGGFLAILLSKPLRARRVVAFTPQWSVDPKIVPEDRRWMEYRAAIQEYRFSDLGGCFDADTRYSIFFGDTQWEHYHRAFFPAAPNIETFVLSGVGHGVAAAVKERGALGSVLATAVTGGDVAAVLHAAGIATLNVQPAAWMT